MKRDENVEVFLLLMQFFRIFQIHAAPGVATRETEVLFFGKKVFNSVLRLVSVGEFTHEV
jgi:hypothetical protein